MWGEIAAIVTAILTVIGMGGGYYKWRKARLRSDDVLSWSNQVIEVLQILWLVCIGTGPFKNEEYSQEKLAEIYIRISVLIEQGRLFFKNHRPDDYGQDKPKAYRGIRPEILDQLVLAHQIAGVWNEANADGRQRLSVLAEQCVKNFVSLAQDEVGRQAVASKYVNKEGKSVSLSRKMSELPEGTDGKFAEHYTLIEMYKAIPLDSPSN